MKVLMCINRYVLFFAFGCIAFLPLKAEVKGGYEQVKEERDRLERDANIKFSSLVKTKKKLDKKKNERKRLVDWYKSLSRKNRIKYAASYRVKKTALDAEIGTLSTKFGGEYALYKPVKNKLNKFKEKCIRLECDVKKYPVYVILISGHGGGYIDKTLKIKEDLRGNRIHLIRGNWNDLDSSRNNRPAFFPNAERFDNFLDQIELEFQRIPENSKVILVGHSLGGGAVIKSSSVAKKINRKIEWLIALDPVGENGIRLNVKKKRPIAGPCSSPRYVDENGDTHGSDAVYASCRMVATNRFIPRQVKNFFNRWQRNQMWPIDFDQSGFIKVRRGVHSDQGEDNETHGGVLSINKEKVREIIFSYMY